MVWACQKAMVYYEIFTCTIKLIVKKSMVRKLQFTRTKMVSFIALGGDPFIHKFKPNNAVKEG
jgi:hypothetical protein